MLRLSRCLRVGARTRALAARLALVEVFLLAAGGPGSEERWSWPHQQCCCREGATPEQLARCFEGATYSSLLHTHASGILVLKTFGQLESVESACTTAAWSARGGHPFFTFLDVRPGSADQAAQLENYFRDAPSGTRWFALVGEHVSAIGLSGDFLHDVLELHAVDADVHLIVARALASKLDTVSTVRADMESSPSEAVGSVSKEVSGDFWLLRRSDWSERFILGLSRKQGALANAFARGGFHQAISLLAARLPQHVKILSASELSVDDGVDPVAPAGQNLLSLSSHPEAVRSVGVRAGLQIECRSGEIHQAASVHNALIAATSEWVRARPGERSLSDAPRLVRMLETQGRRVEADTTAVAALRDLSLTGREPRTVVELLARAYLHRSLGNYTASLSDCRRAAFTEAQRLSAVACMAESLLRTEDRPDEAMLMLRTSLILAMESGDDGRSSATFASLATVHAEAGRLEEAEQLGAQALRLSKAWLGENHPDLADTLIVLADVWRRQKRMGESLRAVTRALGIQRAALPATHPAIGASLNNLGYLLMEKGRHDESLPTLMQAVQVSAQSLGVRHPTVLATLLNVAASHEQLGDHATAERFYQRIGRLREGADEEDQSDGSWLSRYGRLLYKMDRHDESLGRLRSALAVWRRQMVPPNVEVLGAVGTIGAVLHALGRTTESVDVLRNVAALHQQSLGIGHPRTAQTLANLGAALHSDGRAAEALVFMRRGEASLLEHLGPEDPQVKATRQNIAAVEMGEEQRTLIESPGDFDELFKDDPEDYADYANGEVTVEEGW